ncbi:RNA polymerase sigma factor [Sphingomonas sp. MG17]|uniref:RNA polymerase sigma factor n=1 Tax=Sphingomonas tagetis TaxID=2949092 RepID=A0A9X2HJ57_9SPHN|nr:RNA polymerase sigma factor [Sphingomonas tagetis]MCP3732166.1 RNA polymerase sigma factor [Sphingomonas tagetis]
MLDPFGPACGVTQDEDSHRRLAAIYRERAPQLTRYLRSRLRGSDGEDLVHDAFARLARRGSLATLQNPEAYLKRIIRNLLIDRKRRAAVRPQLVDLEDHEPQIRADQTDGIELAQLQTRYRTVVDALPPRTRQVFLLHRVEGQSMKDIAADLDISTRTVEWHVAQAILKIGEALDRP